MDLQGQRQDHQRQAQPPSSAPLSSRYQTAPPAQGYSGSDGTSIADRASPLGKASRPCRLNLAPCVILRLHTLLSGFLVVPTPYPACYPSVARRQVCPIGIFDVKSGLGPPTFCRSRSKCTKKKALFLKTGPRTCPHSCGSDWGLSP